MSAYLKVRVRTQRTRVGKYQSGGERWPLPWKAGRRKEQDLQKSHKRYGQLRGKQAKQNRASVAWKKAKQNQGPFSFIHGIYQDSCKTWRGPGQGTGGWRREERWALRFWSPTLRGGRWGPQEADSDGDQRERCPSGSALGCALRKGRRGAGAAAGEPALTPGGTSEDGMGSRAAPPSVRA